MFKESEILIEETGIMGVVYKNEKYIITEMPNYTERHAIGITNRVDRRFSRISIFEPKYIGAENEDDDLSEEEIKEIIPIISKNWHRILVNMNDQFRYDDEIKEIDLNLPMPNYLELLKGEKVL